ncbi:MAG TPA: hypothetical protein VGM94_01730 [Galbitalea sp.]
MRVRRLALVLLAANLIAACGGPSASSDMEVVGANAVRAEIAAALKEVPLPPGATINPIVPDENAGYEAGFGRQAVEGLAMCAWFRYWLDALASDRTEDVARATETANKMSTWAIYVGADQSYRDVIDNVITNAKLGDPSAMSTFVSANCRTA